MSASHYFHCLSALVSMPVCEPSREALLTFRFLPHTKFNKCLVFHKLLIFLTSETLPTSDTFYLMVKVYEFLGERLNSLNTVLERIFIVVKKSFLCRALSYIFICRSHVVPVPVYCRTRVLWFFCLIVSFIDTLAQRIRMCLTDLSNAR